MMSPRKQTTIIDQLRQAVKDSRQTEYAIAKAAGISQSALNRFVNGHRGISLSTAAKLCRHLQLSLGER